MALLVVCEAKPGDEDTEDGHCSADHWNRRMTPYNTPAITTQLHTITHAHTHAFVLVYVLGHQ